MFLEITKSARKRTVINSGGWPMFSVLGQRWERVEDEPDVWFNHDTGEFTQKVNGFWVLGNNPENKKYKNLIDLMFDEHRSCVQLQEVV